MSDNGSCDKANGVRATIDRAKIEVTYALADLTHFVASNGEGTGNEKLELVIAQIRVAYYALSAAGDALRAPSQTAAAADFSDAIRPSSFHS